MMPTRSPRRRTAEHHQAVLLAATDDDVEFLRHAVLVEAAFPAGTRPPTDAPADDHIARYIEGWGRAGDLGLVAWRGGERVGAAWVRRLPPERPGYGFVDAATPELTVAVVARHRGEGWGRALVTGILDLAAAEGGERVSLSVADAVNPVAVGLYRALGFTEVGRDEGGSLTMVAAAAPLGPAAASGPPTARWATATDGPALARLREVMVAAEGQGGRSGWRAPFLGAWAEGCASGSWRAAVVDDPRGRPVASALAVCSLAPPGPGRERGRIAHLGSVATEPAWRRRGCARTAVATLVEALDRDGVEQTNLFATDQGAGLYTSLGFSPTPSAALRRSHP